MLKEFLLSLLAEAIGILVTVFFVDRLLKRRENRRWAPAKHLLETRLFKLAEDIIYAIIGIGEGYKAWGKLRMYYFGEASVMSYCDVEQIDSSYLVGVITARLKYCESVRFDFEYGPLTQAHGKLNALLDTSAFLIDPAAIELLLQLDEELVSLLRRKEESVGTDSEISELFNCATKAISLHSYLQSRASKVNNLYSSATHY